MNSDSRSVSFLQSMLRVIIKCDDSNQTIVVDGFYGPKTAAIVSTFQRNHGLKPTGITDQDTWEKITEQYEKDLISLCPPVPIHFSWNTREAIHQGMRHSCVPLCQCILSKISECFHCTHEPHQTGELDKDTSEAIEELQALCGLPKTGSIDKLTWKNMALLFPLTTILDSAEAKNE